MTTTPPMPHQNFPYPDTFLIVNRFRMHYYHSGSDDPINVVMLHGSRASAHAYRRFFPHLIAAGFRCFAPDAIGFGQSDKPDDPSIHTFDFHSDNLEIFIRELNLRNLILISHEWGSLTALDYAINRPDNTLALVLTDPGVFLPDRRSGLHCLLHRSFLGDLLVRRLNVSVGQPPAHKPQDVRALTPPHDPDSPSTRLGFLRMTARANLGYNALRMKAIRNSLPGLQTPTLLIRSRDSQLFSHEEFLNLKQQLPYVRALSLPTSDPLNLHNSNTVINAILNFLSPISSSTNTIIAKA